jgi:Spy/CpxP family protein refolding chaperone
MKAKWCVLVVSALWAGPAVALAQPPPLPPGPPGPPDLGRWWKSSEVVSALGLSAAQVKQIEQAFLEHRLKLIDLRADLERQETRLQPLIEADQPDEAQVSAQIDQVTAARGRLEKANAMMMLAVRKVLTVDQWRKLESIRHEREAMRAPRPPLPPQAAPPGVPAAPAQPAPPGRPPRTPRPPQAPRPDGDGGML